MNFQDWDPIVRDLVFGSTFLLPLIAVLWTWYDSSGRTGPARWFWRLILSGLVLLTTPAVILGAANTDNADLMSSLGWAAFACGGMAVLGVVAYAIWGRSPMDEYPEETAELQTAYAQPVRRKEPIDQVKQPQPVAEPAAPAAPAPAPAASVAPAAPPAPATPPEPVGPYLLVKSGADQGRRFPVADEVTIGRGAACGVTLADSKVSSEHGRLKRQGESFVYLDLKSTNGSFLLIEGREERLLAGQALVDGDELRLGTTVLQFIRNGDKR
jgi:Inner membrane component of T3SS, cytoplasmic domain